MFALTGDLVARYDDARRGVGRAIRVERGRIEAVRLSGNIAAQGWLRDYLLRERDVAAMRHRLLLPTAQAPSGFVARGRVVCSCFDVAESEVRVALDGCAGNAEAALRRVQQQLRCGTNCGSCLPELRRLAAGACRLPAEAPA